MIKIRPAAPGDAEPVTLLLDMSGKGHVERSVFELLFPGTEEQRLEKIRWVFLNARRLTFHYSCLTVAEVDGKTIAVGGSCAHKQNSTLDWALTLHDMGMSLTELLKTYLRMRPYFEVKPHIPEDTIELFSGATFPEYRRFGVIERMGQVMIEEILQEGKYNKIMGCIRIGNTAMQGVLEKLGPEKVETRYSKSFERLFNTPGYKIFTFNATRESLGHFLKES